MNYQQPAPPLEAPKRKVDDVHAALKRQIMLSQVTPGQALVELEIAAAMGCSQGTVREALMRLQEEGLIVRKGYGGTIVTPISPLEAQAFLALRAQLESLALAHSLPRIGAPQVQALSGLVRQMEVAADAGDEYTLFELDQQFHVMLFQWAEMPALVPVLTRCSLYNHRNKISLDVAPRTLAETARRHWRVVAALENGDRAEAERVLRHHVESVVGDGAEAEAAREPAPALAPRLAALLKRVQAEDAGLPDITRLPLAQARRQFDAINARWNRLDPAHYRFDAFTIPAPPRVGRAAGEGIAALRVESVRADPSGAAGKATIFFLHGGGWVFGNIKTHRGAMARLAEASGATVVGIDYGLAPEAPFPHGLNDCVWAWRWLRSHADAPSGPWFIAGDSAGANLALSSMLVLRDAGEPLPDGALLFYGVYSADHRSPSHQRCGNGDFGLSSAKMAWYRAHYLAGGRGHADHPLVSPLHADLHRLPPLFITGAEMDPLFDDSTALAKKLADTDTPYEFRRLAGMNHGFMQLGAELPEARAAFRDAGDFVRAHSSHKPKPPSMETT